MQSRSLRSTLFLLGVIVAVPCGAYISLPAFRTAVDEALAILTSTDIEAAIAALVDYLRSFGIWAPVISAALMVFQSVAAPLPAFLLTFANGMMFGWLWGAALSWTSAMAGAALCFWIARGLGRPAVERLAGGGSVLAAADRFFLRFGASSVLVARLLPFVSFDVISYAAGLTPMSFGRFLVATGVGQLPATLLYSWLGQGATGSVRAVFWSFSILASLAVICWALASVFRKKGDAESETAPW